MYRLRDERGVFSDIWASGLMRRAAMAAGRRLAAAGRLHDPEHIVEATADEMCALVSRRRAARRPTSWPTAFTTAPRAPAQGRPPFLGDPPHAAARPVGPAARRRPGHDARSGIALGALFGSSEARARGEPLRGLAASGGVYEGTARRIAGPTEFDRIEQGDVLVTESTTEAFNILLPLLGAIVTDAAACCRTRRSSPASTASPASSAPATRPSVIADGTRVRVDGDAGEVTVHG